MHAVNTHTTVLIIIKISLKQITYAKKVGCDAELTTIAAEVQNRAVRY